MTVWLIILLFEGAFVQLLETEDADKVFRMELAIHGCNTPTHDRLLAGGAERPALGVKVLLAIRLAVVVKETSGIKCRLALLQRQMMHFSEALKHATLSVFIHA